MPKDFEEIQLTKQQIDDLAYNERLRLYFEAKEIQRKNVSKNELIEAKRLFSANELRLYILNKNPHFVLDEYSEPVFNSLCLYFSRNSEFQSKGEGFSLYKGICLTGVPGCGKTEILRLFEKNKRQCFHTININDINEHCKENGLDSFKKFSANVPGWGGKEFFYQDFVTWCIDDVGLEEPVNDFGNKAYVFSKIVQERYSNKHLMQYYPMHITMMLTAQQIEEKYGTFIRSRAREMFNFIHYKGPDRRK